MVAGLPAQDVVVVALVDCLLAQHHFQWVQLLLWLALEELADWVALFLTPVFVETIVSFQHLQPSAAAAAGSRTTVSRMEAQAVAVVVVPLLLLREPVQQDKETQAAQAPLTLAAAVVVLVVLVLPGLQIQAMAMVALALLVRLQELALLMPEEAEPAPV